MKVILGIICWLLVAFSFYFPFAYTHSEQDKMEVKISHILVNTEQEAIDIKKQIEGIEKEVEKENGEKYTIVEKVSFDKMAEEHSLCPSAKDKGNIGYNLRGKLIKEIEDVAFKLNRRELSEPVKTSEGWHIVKVTDIKYYSDKENFGRRYY